MPVVILSSSTAEGSAKAFEALQSGAVEVVGKPDGPFTLSQGATLAQKIKAAAEARLKPTVRSNPLSSADSSDIFRASNGSPGNLNPRALILLGASTGGTEALKTILSAMPDDLPPICVVQHIPAQFSAAFANRLNGLCAMEVREARSGDELVPGLALIAPGGKHLIVRWNGSKYVALLNEGPQVHHQRPAVDVLFDSVVKTGGSANSVAALLTGMGRDGADGLLKLRQNGAHTIAQSEATCVVFGMPREAINLGSASDIVDLQDIAGELTKHGRRISSGSAELAINR
jgi:two-component system chemotaxis response regulator CheB